MCPRKEHTIRIILRTVVVIFLTGFFYIFGKSNEGYAAETKSPPIRQELVHEYARKQIPLARAAHAATYACHEVTSDCDFSRDLRNTEGCRNAERTVKHLSILDKLGNSSHIHATGYLGHGWAHEQDARSCGTGSAAFRWCAFAAAWCEAGGGGAPAQGEPHLGLALGAGARDERTPGAAQGAAHRTAAAAP